jgi:hypothetical protein
MDKAEYKIYSAETDIRQLGEVLAVIVRSEN